MSMFDELCENSDYIRHVENNEEEVAIRKKAIEMTLKFLIKNREKTFTFTQLQGKVGSYSGHKGLIGFRFHGEEGYKDVGYILGAANEIIKEYCKKKIKNTIWLPPISTLIISGKNSGKNGTEPNEGAHPFIRQYLGRTSRYQLRKRDWLMLQCVILGLNEEWKIFWQYVFGEQIKISDILPAKSEKNKKIDAE